MKFLLASLLLVVCVYGVCGAPTLPQWGPEGHYMTAVVAQNYLNANATAACKKLLPNVGGNIGLIASWADSVARQKYPWSPPLHYINTPDWKCNYFRSRDCKGEKDGAPMVCVDGAIQNYTSQLAKNSGEYDLTEALMFLVHFIGDIHQPLHVGFTTDMGGNTQHGTFFKTKCKLHQVWDDNILNKRLKDDFQNTNSSYVKYLINRIDHGDWSGEVNAWKQCTSGDPFAACSPDWANESVQLTCTNAEIDEQGKHITDGFELGDRYYQKNYPVIEKRIAMGGIRLANVLNNIFDMHAAAEMQREQEIREESGRERDGGRATIAFS